MKKTVLVCLLGMVLLLPTAKVNSSAVNHFCKRIVDVTLDGVVLIASSDANTGTITQVKVFDKATQRLVLTQSCSGYFCYVDVDVLDPGTYVAKVFTTSTTYLEEFSL